MLKQYLIFSLYYNTSKNKYKVRRTQFRETTTQIFLDKIFFKNVNWKNEW
jgi:hypothetical protein